MNRPTIDLLLLTWAAGFMDALSYLRSGVFTANMTGNTVVLGLSLAGPERSRLLPCSVSLCSFAVGVLIAAVFLIREAPCRDERRDLKFGMALELPFAIAFGLLSFLAPQRGSDWRPVLIIATAACALGIQSVAVRRLMISGVVTTFITGTITTAIVTCVQGAAARTPAREEKPNSPFALATMLACYVAAAAAGAGLSARHGALSALIPVITLCIVLFRSLE
jgi:uncharacterized membrane protein YoaK (UPF0700 family)